MKRVQYALSQKEHGVRRRTPNFTRHLHTNLKKGWNNRTRNVHQTLLNKRANFNRRLAARKVNNARARNKKRINNARLPPIEKNV